MTLVRCSLSLLVALAMAGPAGAQVSPAPPAAAQPAVARPAPPAAPGGVRAEPVPPRVEAAFKAWDTNRDGALTLAEFRAGWQGARRGGAQAGLQQQFKQIDANGDGGIDRTEYPNLLLVKRAGAAAPPFSEFDRNNTQKLEFDEYTALVRKLSAKPAAPATPANK